MLVHERRKSTFYQVTINKTSVPKMWINITLLAHSTLGQSRWGRTDWEKEENDVWHILYLHRTHLGPLCWDDALILCIKNAADLKRPPNQKPICHATAQLAHHTHISSYRCKHPTVVKHRLIPTGWVWKTQNLTPFKVSNTNCHICIAVTLSAGSTAERADVRLTDRDRCSHPAPLPPVNTRNVIILQQTQTTQMFNPIGTMNVEPRMSQNFSFLHATLFLWG